MRSLAVLTLVIGVSVAAALSAHGRVVSLELAVQPSTVTYGTAVALRGAIPSRQAGERVEIYARPCGYTEPALIATVLSGPEGRFRYAVEPLLNTTFSARFAGVSSPGRSVAVMPALRLRRLSVGLYQAQVHTTNGLFLDGRWILLQRLVGRTWVTIRRAKLRKASSEFALTLTSAAEIAAVVPAKSRLRVLLPQFSATCYRAAASKPIRS